MNNLFLSRKGFGFLGFCLLCGTVFTPVQAKTIWLEADDFRTEMAQGDGEEPVTFSLTDDELKIRASAGDVQKETVSDEKIPTLTAEGDFLLPTYVLPETQVDESFSKVASVDENNPWRQETVSVPFPALEDKTTQVVTVETHRVVTTQPVSAAVSAPQPTPIAVPVAAKPAPADQKVLQNIEKQYQATNELLRQTSQKLAVLEQGLNDIATTRSAKADCAANENVRRSPLLLPLAPVKEAVSEVKPKDEIKAPASGYEQKEYIDYVLSVIKRVSAQPVSFNASDEAVLRSIPKEMKINFLPETADISNQSMKWIKAFSYNPSRTVENAVEVRMSGKDLDLQSRRFALIKGALLSNGLTPRQIRFVLTDRDPDSIILRNITLPLEEEVFSYRVEKNKTPAVQIIQKW